MKRTARDVLTDIIFLQERGLSVREIARRTGLNPSTVSRHLKKNKPEEEKKSTGGRPTKLSARIIKHFLRLVEAGHLKNATDIAEFILSRHSIKVTKWTIARILKSHGFKSYAKPKKPRLTQKHKKARRNFALIMSKLPEERWKTVVFTDESKICALVLMGISVCGVFPGVVFLTIILHLPLNLAGSL